MLPRHPLLPLPSLVLLIAPLAACGARNETPVAPSVLLISVDTLRADHLGCYGYARETSPGIDRLARRGVVFENAMSTCPWTLPSHTSLLTGLYPAEHGVQEDTTTLGSDVPTLAEAFRAAGYHTFAVVAHVYVSSAFGLDRGFVEFDDSLIDEGRRNPVASEVVDRTLELLDAAPPGPFFCFVHLFDPHWDYSPPAPFDTRFTDPGYRGTIDGSYARILAHSPPTGSMSAADLAQLEALYDGEIAYTDQQVSRLLEGLEQRKHGDTVVVLTADHGEAFLDHGGLGHGKSLYVEQLHVPLVIAGHPAFEQGTRRPDPVSTVDLMPTLLELLETPAVRVENSGSGQSLSHPPGPSRADFAETRQFGRDMRAARLDDAKVIRFANQEAYFDLRSDRAEQRPLEHDPTGGRLADALADYAAEADAGWHLKLVAVQGAPLHCRATIRAAGEIVDVRQYFSRMMSVAGKAADVRFSEFEIAEGGRRFVFEVELSASRGEVVFDTEPPDLPVDFEIELSSSDSTAAVYLGRGVRIPNGEPIRLERTDPRIAGFPEQLYDATGCFVRAVAPTRGGEPAALSDDAREELRAMGYAGDEEPSGEER